MGNKTTILAFDPSLTSPGHSVIEIKKGKPKLIEFGHIKTNYKQHPSYRLRLIRNYIEGVYLNWEDKIDCVVRESVIFNRFNTKTIEDLCHVAGLIVSVCSKHEVQKISPNKAKEFVTGTTKVIKNNKNAEKQRVENAVRELLKLAEDFEFESSDESDACCIGLAFAIQEGIIKIGAD